MTLVNWLSPDLYYWKKLPYHREEERRMSAVLWWLDVRMTDNENAAPDVWWRGSWDCIRNHREADDQCVSYVRVSGEYVRSLMSGIQAKTFVMSAGIVTLFIVNLTLDSGTVYSSDWRINDTGWRGLAFRNCEIFPMDFSIFYHVREEGGAIHMFCEN